MRPVPGETRLLEYVRYLDAHCGPDELVFKEGTRKWTAATLFQELPSRFRRGLIIGHAMGKGVEHLHVRGQTFFGKSEMHLSIHWSPDRQGWSAALAQVHYFVNRKLLEDAPLGHQAVLISLCRRFYFENNEPFLTVNRETHALCAECCEAIRGIRCAGVGDAPPPSMAGVAGNWTG